MRSASPLLCASLAVLCALSACAPVDPAMSTPSSSLSPSGPASPAPATASPSASAESEQPAVATLSEVTTPELDVDVLGSADRGSMTNNSPAYYGGWLTVGVPMFDDAGKAYVKGVIDAWAEDQPSLEGIPDGDVPLPELNVQPQLTAAGPDVVGQRFWTREFAGASAAAAYRTLWFDVSEERVGGSSMLFTDDGVRDAFTAIVDALRADPLTDEELVDQLAAEEPKSTFDDGALDSLNFSADGMLVAEFDDYSVAPGSAGTIEVTIPADEAAGWLSEFGKAAAEGAAHPTKPEFASPTPEAPSTSAAPAPAPAVEGPDCTKVKCVALTFDDGPGPKTGELLDILDRAGAKATFFVIGPNVESYPAVVKRASAEGHQIAAHTWTHTSMTKQTAAEIQSEVNRTSDAVKAATGKPTRYMRPPYGAINKDVRAALGKLPEAPAILWSVDTLDWQSHDPAAILKEVQAATKPGGIILMHDIHATTIQAVPAVVEWLQGQGYELVTVEQLLASESPASGHVFSHLG